MITMASHIICVSSVCSTVCMDANQRKYQSSASLAFKKGIYRWPVDSPHKGPATRKMFPFDDAIIYDDHQLSKQGSFCWIGPLSVTILLTTLFWIITAMHHNGDDSPFPLCYIETNRQRKFSFQWALPSEHLTLIYIYSHASLKPRASMFQDMKRKYYIKRSFYIILIQDYTGHRLHAYVILTMNWFDSY